MAKITVVAEAGVNHNGRLDLALQMVEAAAEAGADVIKFQTFHTAALVSAQAPKAAYQLQNTKVAESQMEMLRRLEFSADDFRRLLKEAHQYGLEFLSTPFDLPSLDLLLDLGLETIKIPSGEITNTPFLRVVGYAGKRIFLSTGMADLKEVGQALAVLETAGTTRSMITLFHCTSDYPAKPEEVNLRAMLTLRDSFPGLAAVGYSDHTEGLEASVAAAAMGATVLEKHFTLDRNLEGPDHRASLTPVELAELVRRVRLVEKFFGDGIKRPSYSEMDNKAVVRKSILAARPIAAGEIFTLENLTVKRPGSGLSPGHWDAVLGRSAKRAYAFEEPLEVSEID